MPPKRKTLAPKNQSPQRSSERLRLKMNVTPDKSSISPTNFSTPTPRPPPEKKIKTKKVKKPIVKKPNPSSPGEKQDEETPIRHHLIVTKEEDVKRFEELDDCFILGFDPIERNDVKQSYVVDKVAGSPEIAIVAEKGQVACRDYPHSRHQCVKFPFGTTAHSQYCELCYCYVCDTAAPCKLWASSTNNALLSHCDANDNNGVWKRERVLRNLGASYKHKQ